MFIFERLCNIIYPVSIRPRALNRLTSSRQYITLLNCLFQEENDTSEFQLLLEKDPQQEDFLQGRMLGNPYK